MHYLPGTSALDATILPHIHIAKIIIDMPAFVNVAFEYARLPFIPRQFVPFTLASQ